MAKIRHSEAIARYVDLEAAVGTSEEGGMGYKMKVSLNAQIISVRAS